MAKKPSGPHGSRLRWACFIEAVIGCVLAAIVSGCAGGYASSAVMPGVDLKAYHTAYVVRHDQDTNDLHRVVASRLTELGLRSTSGPADARPADVNVVVIYEDRWTWDMAPYMLTLKIDLRDPQTNVLLASGQAYHPSLERRTPPAMVDEVLGSIFGRS